MSRLSAQSGKETIRLIEQIQPDPAFLDLQMPELDGLSIVRSFRHGRIPLVAFVTAFDALLNPVDQGRLCKTINRAHERLERAAFAEQETDEQSVRADRESSVRAVPCIDRFPIRKQDDLCVTRSPYCIRGLRG